MQKIIILLCLSAFLFTNCLFANNNRNIFSYKHSILSNNDNSTLIENNLIYKGSKDLSFGIGYALLNHSSWNSNLYQPNIIYNFYPFYLKIGYGFGYYSDSSKFNNYSFDLTSETAELLYGISYKLTNYPNITTTIISPYINYPYDTSHLYGAIYLSTDSNGNKLTSYLIKMSYIYNTHIQYSFGYSFGNELVETNANTFTNRKFNNYLFDIAYSFSESSSIKTLIEKRINSDSTSEFTSTLLFDNRF